MSLDEIFEEALHSDNTISTTELMALPDGFRPTDVGNANRLIAASIGRLRYVHAWLKWLVYDEGRWTVDHGDAMVTEQAKQVARRLFHMAAGLERDQRHDVIKFASRCESASSVSNSIRLARAIPGVIIDHEELDTNPWLLNVRNGTVDLRTGQLRPHDPDDLLTMQAPVIFDANADAPLWRSCLERWQPDPEILAYLQRAIGTAATGHPVEALIANVGTGANGKTKFYNTIAMVLGQFAVVPHKSLIVASKHEGHPTHVASLFRARMLVAPETSQDDRLDEEMVKNLTGGDQLRARRMREDEWTFSPTHTAFRHTNHRPRIRGVDEGIWRRLKLIPWSITIPRDERDELLAAKLAEESSGILNWMVAGALAWQERGLDEPAAITAATAEYRTAEDHIGKFLTDKCIIGDNYMVTTKALRTAYETWCTDTGETELSPQRLGRDVAARGFDQTRLGQERTRTWLGIGLLAEGDRI